MTAPTYPVYDGDLLASPIVVPRDPSEDDAGGTDTQDNPTFPPHREVHPNAEHWNRQGVILRAIAPLFPVAELAVTGTATPSVISFKGLNTTLAASKIVLLQRVSVGLINVAWENNLFPAGRNRPWSVWCANGVNSIGAEAAQHVVGGVTYDGLIVRTFEGNAPEDAYWRVRIG